MKKQKHGKFKRREERFQNPNRDPNHQTNFKKYIVTPDNAKMERQQAIRAKRIQDLAKIKEELNTNIKDENIDEDLEEQK